MEGEEEGVDALIVVVQVVAVGVEVLQPVQHGHRGLESQFQGGDAGDASHDLD